MCQRVNNCVNLCCCDCSLATRSLRRSGAGSWRRRRRQRAALQSSRCACICCTTCAVAGEIMHGAGVQASLVAYFMLHTPVPPHVTGKHAGQLTLLRYLLETACQIAMVVPMLPAGPPGAHWRAVCGARE
jgi:hypothetical protein